MKYLKDFNFTSAKEPVMTPFIRLDFFRGRACQK